MSKQQANGNEKPCTTAQAYNDLPRFTALVEQVRQKKTQNTTDHSKQQENGNNGK